MLHAVGPAMDDYEDESEAYAMLQKTFEQSLYTAKKNGCKSVAIPAISSGICVCSVSVNSIITFLIQNLVKLLWGVTLAALISLFRSLPKSRCKKKSLCS